LGEKRIRHGALGVREEKTLERGFFPLLLLLLLLLFFLLFFLSYCARSC